MNRKKLVPLLLIVIAGVGWFFYEKYHAQQNDGNVIYGNVDIPATVEQRIGLGGIASGNYPGGL